MSGRVWLLAGVLVTVMTCTTASRAEEGPAEARFVVNGSGTGTPHGDAQAAEVAKDVVAPVTTGSVAPVIERPASPAPVEPAPPVSPAAPAAPAPPVAPPTKATAEPVEH